MHKARRRRSLPLAELRQGRQERQRRRRTTTPAWEGENYDLPGLDLLDEHDVEGRVAADPAELERIQQTLIETLHSSALPVRAGDITRGPTITRYEVYPAKGVAWTRS
jgi:S-DNA-T family DNA segregation ATPase FtsK/SpoIIIE